MDEGRKQAKAKEKLQRSGEPGACLAGSTLRCSSEKMSKSECLFQSAVQVE